MADTLFGHLATRFGTHPEDLATEALGYILRGSGPARDAIRDLLGGFGVELPLHLDYRNQVTADDNARPDLVACDTAGVPLLIIEAKFWAGLTNNQPVTYLGRLPKEGRGALLVVAPAARMTILWGELIRRCGDAQHSVDEARLSVSEARAATVAGHKLVALSWRALLDVILAKLETAGDRRGRDDIAQICGLCDRMDSDAFLPLTSEEMTTQHYRRVVEFGAIADDAVTLLASAGVVSVQGLRAASGNGYYGRYVSIRGWGAFFACDVHKWMKHASTPLWLSVWGPKWTKSDRHVVHRALDALASSSPRRLFSRQDGFPTIAVMVQVGVEREAIVDSVVEQITYVAGLIPLLGAGAGVEAGASDANAPLPADEAST